MTLADALRLYAAIGILMLTPTGSDRRVSFRSVVVTLLEAALWLPLVIAALVSVLIDTLAALKRQ